LWWCRSWPLGKPLSRSPPPGNWRKRAPGLDCPNTAFHPTCFLNAVQGRFEGRLVDLLFASRWGSAGPPVFSVRGCRGAWWSAIGYPFCHPARHRSPAPRQRRGAEAQRAPGPNRCGGKKSSFCRSLGGAARPAGRPSRLDGGVVQPGFCLRSIPGWRFRGDWRAPGFCGAAAGRRAVAPRCRLRGCVRQSSTFEPTGVSLPADSPASWPRARRRREANPTLYPGRGGALGRPGPFKSSIESAPSRCAVPNKEWWGWRAHTSTGAGGGFRGCWSFVGAGGQG